MAGQDAWGTSFRRETDTPGTFESIANCTDISGPSREREVREAVLRIAMQSPRAEAADQA